MIMQETWVMINHLKHQGLSIRAIARQLSLDRNTVRRALRRDGLPPQTCTVPRASKLDPCKPDLERRLVACPELSAVRLYQEIQAQGYPGRCSIRRDFLRPLRQEHRRWGPLTVRFETAPGEQGQVEWGHLGTILHQGERGPLYGFVMVLGYSRALFVHFTTTQRLETFLRCHLLAFEAFGGSPRALLYDHAKTVVLARPDLRPETPRPAPHWQPQFLDFAGDDGLTPRLCRPYRARPKGKVDRMIRQVRENFFAGGHVVDLEDLNRPVALWWATVANARVHATTGEVPTVRFVREPLLPVTGRPPDALTLVVPRRVSSSCLVAQAGHHDSVPYLYGGRQVQLHVHEEHARLEIWAEDTGVAIPPLLSGHGRQSLQPEHLTGLWRLTLQGKGQRPLPPPSPPPPREEATGVLHLPTLPVLPDVEVRPLRVYAALAEEVPA